MTQSLGTQTVNLTGEVVRLRSARMEPPLRTGGDRGNRGETRLVGDRLFARPRDHRGGLLQRRPACLWQNATEAGPLARMIHEHFCCNGRFTTTTSLRPPGSSRESSRSRRTVMNHGAITLLYSDTLTDRRNRCFRLGWGNS